MNSLLMQTGQIKTLYNTLSSHKNKEKIDMVLEPLQSMLQIALLSVSPIGTKLTIQENILYLQQPSLIQPVSRWYNADKKDDLYFLFQVIKRFIKWYNPVSSKRSPISLELYLLIVQMGIRGLDNLIRTYNTSGNLNILQVINMYKNLLEPVEKLEEKHVIEKVHIDEVFENIMEIYDKNLILLIHNLLIMLQKESDSTNIYNYIIGLNSIMQKNNNLIKNWIKSNLIL